MTWTIATGRTNFHDSPSNASTQEDELDITPELLEEFENDLGNRGITVDFISGGWSAAFVDLALSGRKEEDRTLILASETIYSPASLAAFTETLLALLRRSTAPRANSRAMVAAKKVYFGVGGGVDEFLMVLRDFGNDEFHVDNSLDVKSEGVGRVVLEIIGTTRSNK